MTKMGSTSNETQKFKILRPNETLILDSNPKPVATGSTGINHNSEDFDNSARIFKSINDVQRFLDVKRSKCSTVLDLFTTCLEAQRMRLKSYCERLMFKDPLAYGREAKDILWKKCYYDVISTAKLLRSDSQWQPDELSCVQIHLQSGIGHYHHILKRFQQEFNISLTERKTSGKNPASALDQWATGSIYCVLIHLGDLSRYKLDLYHSASISAAAAYYYASLNWRPTCGLPHNQLATLYNGQAAYVNAAYHYFRCLTSPKPFQGATCNLRILADKNKQRMRHNEAADSIPMYKLLVEHFVNISYSLYHDMPVKQEEIELFISYLESCLGDMPPPCVNPLQPAAETSGQGFDHLDMSQLHVNHVHVSYLLPWIQLSITKAQENTLDSLSLMKLCAVTWLLCYRLRKQNSKKLPLCMDLVYQLMSLIVTTTVDKLNELLKTVEIEPANPALEVQNKEEDDMKKILGSCRRRTRRRIGSSESMNGGYHHHHDGEDSEEEILFDLKLSDEKGPVVQKKETGDAMLTCFIQLSETENFLQTIRVFVDWLSFDRSVLLYSSPSATSFMQVYCQLLNLVSRVRIPPVTPITGHSPTLGEGESVGEELDPARIPLGEDWELRGMPPLHHIHATYKWNETNTIKYSAMSQVAIRLTRLRDFGSLLQSPGVEYLLYDEAACTHKLNEARQVTSNGSADKLSNGGYGDRMNGGVRSLLNSSLGSSEENGVLNLSHYHMTQMSNSSSPNHFPEEGGEDKNGFGSDEDQSNETQDIDNVLMKNGKVNGSLNNNRLLGQAWLKSEVNKLDSQIRHNNEARSFSPLLVLSTEVLASSPGLVKQLVYARTFLLVIPSLVIEELDELKQGSGRVRDTIRWLEVQLRSGNRFLRTQRLDERKELPMIKYPKKKDKETWNMFQILELCHYLSSRFNEQGDQQNGDRVVTLLIGHDKTCLPSAVTQVAASAGIELENIGLFYQNWKALVKSPG